MGLISRVSSRTYGNNMDIVREQEKLDEELSLDIAQRMQSTCYRFCTENVYNGKSSQASIHSDSKLKVGEKTCLDNCAFKYLTSQKHALEYVNKITQENMLKQQESMDAAATVQQDQPKRKKLFG